MSKSTAINIYNTIIKPHFGYGSTILFTSSRTNQLAKMQKLQNRAMKRMQKCNHYPLINSMLNNLKCMSIVEQFQFNTIRFIRKFKQGDAPKYLCDQIYSVGHSQLYQLRKGYEFRIQRVRSTQVQKTLFYKSLQLFTSLPNNVKNKTNGNVLYYLIITCYVYIYYNFVEHLILIK